MAVIIAIVDGANPSWFARTFLDIPELDRNIAHSLCMVMGLYIALGLFWLYAAFLVPHRNVAVLTTAIFVGVRVSRPQAGQRPALPGTINQLIPPPNFYIVAELALAPLAYWVYSRDD